MNRFTLLIAAFVAALSSARADSFEGKIEMSVSSGSGQAQAIEYEVRGDQIRMDVAHNGQQATVIMDMQKQQMMILIPQRHMYMVRPLAPAGPGSEGGPGNTQPTTSSSGSGIVPTGEKATILGYPCTKYTVNSPRGGTVSVWVTDALGTFGGFAGMTGGANAGRGGMPGGGQPSGWEQALMGKAFFPLKVSGTDAQGKSFNLNVTSVQRESLPDSDFQPPAGYQEFNLGNMMGGLGR